MKVFDKKIEVKKKEDGFTLSAAVNDSSLFVVQLTEKELRLLNAEIKELLDKIEE